MELIILIGLQGAGKSTFYRQYFAETYAYVSKDQFRNNRKPARRQQQLIDEYLQNGQSVVVDNTNVTIADRALLIEQGRNYGAQINGYYFPVQLEASRKRNQQREGKARVPDVAIYTALKRLISPTPQEGFDHLFYVQTESNFQFVITPWSLEQTSEILNKEEKEA